MSKKIKNPKNRVKFIIKLHLKRILINYTMELII